MRCRGAPTREAHAHLALAHAAQITQRSVEADAGPRYRSEREERKQHGAQAILNEGVTQVLVEGHDGVNAARGLQLVNAAADGVGHLHGVAARADEVVRERIGRAGAEIQRRGRRLVQSLFARIAHNAANNSVNSVQAAAGVTESVADGRRSHPDKGWRSCG